MPLLAGRPFFNRLYGNQLCFRVYEQLNLAWGTKLPEKCLMNPNPIFFVSTANVTSLQACWPILYILHC